MANTYNVGINSVTRSKKMKAMKLASLVVVLAAAAVPVHAILISSSVGGSALSDMNYLDFNTEVDPSMVTLTPDAKWVTGDREGEYAAPFLTGNNNQNFGSLYSGDDDTMYLTSGNFSNPGGTIEFNFADTQDYFGLLWGSVDTYNTLTFVLNGVDVGTVVGSQVLQSCDGFQGEGGSAYVNITGISFDRVRVTSSQYAFELDNVAYGKVPDGGMTVSLLGLSLGALALVRRRFVA